MDMLRTIMWLNTGLAVVKCCEAVINVGENKRPRTIRTLDHNLLTQAHNSKVSTTIQVV